VAVGVADLAALRGRFAETAAEVDAGARDVRDGLRWLAAERRLCPPGSAPGRVVEAVRSIRAVAGAGLADAFAVWSQTMVVEYLLCCPPGDGLAHLVGSLREATITGATGMAPAIADLAGQAPLPVVAEADADGWRLTGLVPWASNLFDDAVLVVPARTGDGRRIVGLLRLGAPGVRVRPAPPLLALDTTATGSVDLDGAVLSAAVVLTRDLAGFMRLCQPVMLLTQAAMALGVADAALASAGEALHGLGAGLAGEHAALVGRRDEVAERVTALAVGDNPDVGPGGPAAVRLDALQLVAEAVNLDGVLQGGEGFRADSPTSRRRREAAFLPVQAPTEVQLRSQLVAMRGGGARRAC
jgi:alkylation response protein AidB-like acyl-CoA dehydrogenase